MRAKLLTPVLCRPLLARVSPSSPEIELHSNCTEVLLNVIKLATHSVQVAMRIHIPGLRPEYKPLVGLKRAPPKRKALLVPALSHWAPRSYCLREGCPCVCVMVKQRERESISVVIKWSLVCYGLEHHVMRLMEERGLD